MRIDVVVTGNQPLDARTLFSAVPRDGEVRTDAWRKTQERAPGPNR